MTNLAALAAVFLPGVLCHLLLGSGRNGHRALNGPKDYNLEIGRCAVRFVVGIVGSLALALAALGQITATTLRGKYGPPLKSYAPGSAESFRPGKSDVDIVVNYAKAETFKVRSDIEILVNYGSNAHVCLIDLPRTESGWQASADSETQRQLREVLDELVPPSMRGKELRSLLQQFGLTSASMTECENLTITSVTGYPDSSKPQTVTSITVRFKDAACPANPIPMQHRKG